MSNTDATQSTAGTPLVSIGLPVYNGGSYLPESIKSLLAQTYRNIEIIVSDNASTDNTEQICREFAQHDARVAYSRLPHNIGGVANHTRLRELAHGEFFMWASSDDIWQPTYIERCLDILKTYPGVVLVYAINAQINEKGEYVRNIPQGPALDSDDVLDRWVKLTDIYRAIEPFYGLMRRDALVRAARMTRHPGFDRILLAEMGLFGKLRQVPEPLYCRRIHEKQSIHAYPSLRSRYRWINPNRSQRFVWPHFEYAFNFALAAIRSAPGLNDRIACLWHMLRWCNWHRKQLWEDLIGAD